MLNKLLPYALIKKPNPIFDFDQRHLSWPRRPSDLRRYSANLLGATIILSIVVCCLIFGSHGSFNNSSVSLYVPIAYLLGLMNGAALVISDISMMVATIPGLNRQIMSVDWEMVKLSLQSSETIFTAKIATARLRAWRMMILEVAVRIVGAIPVYFLVVAPYLTSGSLTVYPNYYLGAYLDVFLNLGLVLLFFIVEPALRMPVNVALALAAAAQIRNSGFAVLAGVGLAAAMHLLQGMAVFATLWILGYFPYFINGGAWSIRAGLIALCIVLVLFYRGVQVGAERYALRKLFRPDDT